MPTKSIKKPWYCSVMANNIFITSYALSFVYYTKYLLLIIIIVNLFLIMTGKLFFLPSYHLKEEYFEM